MPASIAVNMVHWAVLERQRFESLTPLQRQATILNYLRGVGISGMANWCAAFVSHVTALATGAVPGPHPQSAGARQWGRRALALGWRDVRGSRPQPGDVWVFWRVAPHAWQGHIGIVVQIDDAPETGVIVTTLEGNVGGSKGDRIIGFRKYNSVGAPMLAHNGGWRITSASRLLQALRPPS